MDGMGWFTSKISYCMLLIAALFTRKTGRVSSLPPSLLPSLPPWFLGWFLAQANNSAVMSTSPVPTLTASPAIVPLTARSLCVCVCARACGCTGKWQTHSANHGILMRVRVRVRANTHSAADRHTRARARARARAPAHAHAHRVIVSHGPREKVRSGDTHEEEDRGELVADGGSWAQSCGDECVGGCDWLHK